MSDKKISQLPASTTPLAGTEELAIVQSGDTKKVTIDNLTAGKTVPVGSLTSAATVVSGTDVEVGRNLRMKDAGGTGTLRTIVNYDAVNDLRISTGTTAGSRSILLQTEGADQLKVDASGNVTALTVNLVIGSAGKGIDFSADSSAAGMTSELLNDYEEGTWTPTLIATGVNYSSVTYNASNGARYTKIGNRVFVSGTLRTNSITVGSASGNLAIGNLPFTVATSTSGTADAASSGCLSYVTGFISNRPGWAEANPSSTYIILLYRTAVDGDSLFSLYTNPRTDGTTIRFSAQYVTA
jgi:hypothetical protein